MNKPCINLYPGDLLREPSFSGLSLAAQGLWLRMLMLMHDACSPGALVNANGMPMSCSTLAGVIGKPADEVQVLLNEMEALGTFSRLTNGTIYNRRMYKGTLRSHHARAAANARWHPGKRCSSDARAHAQNASSSSSSFSVDAQSDSSPSPEPVKKQGPQTHKNTERSPVVPARDLQPVSAAQTAAVACETPPPASLNGHTLPAFEAWWRIWSQVRGTNHRQQAFEAWLLLARQQLLPLPDVIECTRSYLASLTDPAKGYNPENFLRDQSRGQFKARWPPRRAGPAQDRSAERDRLFRELMQRKGLLQ